MVLLNNAFLPGFFLLHLPCVLGALHSAHLSSRLPKGKLRGRALGDSLRSCRQVADGESAAWALPFFRVLKFPAVGSLASYGLHGHG